MLTSITLVNRLYSLFSFRYHVFNKKKVQVQQEHYCLSISSVSDDVVNLDDAYEETPNIEVIYQDSTNANNKTNIFYLIGPISIKIIAEWKDNLFM